MAIKRSDFSSAFFIIFMSLCIEFCICSEINTDVAHRRRTHDFDLLLFTQSWPVTTCLTWKGKDPDHTCLLPTKKDTWIIHGLWPTKIGTMGPFNCDNSLPFDLQALDPIINQLRQYWLNVYKGTPEDSLWKHEWTKHGTCAAQLKQLGTEKEYFSKGLEWLTTYTMSSVLANANIHPGSQYDVNDIHNAVQSSLKINAAIHCVHEKSDPGKQYLAEIRICFDKTLNLFHCNGIVGAQFDLSLKDGIITNCNMNQKVLYPTMPQHILDNIERESVKAKRHFPLVNIYKLVQLIKWMTL